MIRLSRTMSAMILLVLVVGCAKQVAKTPVTENKDQGHTLEHVVAQGETLGRIADNYYGDPAMATMIASSNGISDPDRIVPGSVLVLRFDDGQWQGARKRSVALDAYNQGVDLMAQDRLAEAEKQFRLALDTAPDLQSASYNLALVLSQRGKNSEAVELLEELTAQRPEEADFHFAQGHCLFLLTRFTEAGQQFEKVLELEPENKRALFSLARSQQEGGEKSQAMGSWQRYLAMDSTSSWADAARRNLKKLQDGS